MRNLNRRKNKERDAPDNHLRSFTRARDNLSLELITFCHAKCCHRCNRSFVHIWGHIRKMSMAEKEAKGKRLAIINHIPSPASICPSQCAALNLVTRSLESNPALSAKITGIALNDFANASVAIALFPLTLLAASSTAQDMSISEHPPPSTVRVSLTVCERTERASCKDRSASSTIWFVDPRRTTVQASPAATPENLMS